VDRGCHHAEVGPLLERSTPCESSFQAKYAGARWLRVQYGVVGQQSPNEPTLSFLTNGQVSHRRRFHSSGREVCPVMFFPICLIRVNSTVISRSKGSSLTSINTNYTGGHLPMKRLILSSTLVCLIAVLHLPVSSARAEFETTLFPSNATLRVADAGHGTAVTIFYVGRTLDSDVFTYNQVPRKISSSTSCPGVLTRHHRGGPIAK
jgi:hypothetical protein